jgi:hypothetical protein
MPDDTHDTHDGGVEDERDQGELCVLCARPTRHPDRLHLGCRDLVDQRRAPGERRYRFAYGGELDVVGDTDEQKAMNAEVAERRFISAMECGYKQGEDPVQMARLAEPCPELHDSWAEPGYDVPPLAVSRRDDGWTQCYYVCPVEDCGQAWGSAYSPLVVDGAA